MCHCPRLGAATSGGMMKERHRKHVCRRAIETFPQIRAVKHAVSGPMQRLRTFGGLVVLNKANFHRGKAAPTLAILMLSATFPRSGHRPPTSRGRRNSSRVGQDAPNPEKPPRQGDQSRGQLGRQDLVRQSPNRLCRRVRKFVQTTSENDTGV